MAAQFPEEQSDSGEFQRQEDAFREWISADGLIVRSLVDIIFTFRSPAHGRVAP